MAQEYIERSSRQTFVTELLQQAILNLCQANYAACAPNLEVDGIICISFPDGPDQHVVKIHEKVHLNNFGGNQNEIGISKFDRIHHQSNSHNAHQMIYRNKEAVGMNWGGIQKPITDSDFLYKSRNPLQEASTIPHEKSRNHDDSYNVTNISHISRNFACSKSLSLKEKDNENKNVELPRSKRKMFKVVQRIKNVQEDSSDSSNEMPSAKTDGEKFNQCHQGQMSKSDEVSNRLDSLSNEKQKMPFNESVENGYVIVNMEDSQVRSCFNEEKSENHLDKVSKTSDKRPDDETDHQPTRRWIQLPLENEGLTEYSKSREPIITIDGQTIDLPNDSRDSKDNSDDDGHNVRSSAAHVDLTKEDLCFNGDQLQNNFKTQSFQVKDSPEHGNRSSITFPTRFSSSLLSTTPTKGAKNVDSILFNKCLKYPPPNPPSTSTSTSDVKTSPYSISLSTDKEKKYFCRHCGKGFTLKCTRSRHEKTICGGGGESQYQCHICLKVFTRSDSRCRHLWKTHGIEKMQSSMYA